jgi:hypothetical protein
LNTREDLPEVLVSSARVLADEVDAASDSSPLWGRYTALMQALTEPRFQERAFNAEVRALYEEFATMQAAEEWRAQRYRRAVDDGEPHPARWTKLVPLGCAMQQHRWHQWGPRVAKDVPRLPRAPRGRRRRPVASLSGGGRCGRTSRYERPCRAAAGNRRSTSGASRGTVTAMCSASSRVPCPATTTARSAFSARSTRSRRCQCAGVLPAGTRLSWRCTSRILS